MSESECLKRSVEVAKVTDIKFNTVREKMIMLKNLGFCLRTATSFIVAERYGLDVPEKARKWIIK